MLSSAMPSCRVRYVRELYSKIIGQRRNLLTYSPTTFVSRQFLLIKVRQNVSVSLCGDNRGICTSKFPYTTQRRTTAIGENDAKKETPEHFDIKLFLKQGMEEFDAVYPVIIQDLTFNDLGDYSIEDVLNWQRKVLDYNVPHGKKNRGLAVLSSYKLLAKENDLTQHNLKLACILGWCVEMVQANFLVLDDVMDQSTTRRGMPCWFRVDGVGLMALNDAILIENGIYYLLKKYFRSLPCYVDILEIFHQMVRYTSFGQCLDMLSTPSGQRPKFELFTEDRYSAIVKYKTAYYSYLLPVKLALCLAGQKDEMCHTQAEKILLKMGHFFQIQDDFLDCYGDAAVMGKQGTDIQDGKCSWLIVSALKMASNVQRNTLMNNYGCCDDLSVKKVKDVYDELNLKSIYLQLEEKMFQELNCLIDDVTSHYELPPEMFHSIMMMIYKRKR